MHAKVRVAAYAQRAYGRLSPDPVRRAAMRAPSSARAAITLKESTTRTCSVRPASKSAATTPRWSCASASRPTPTPLNVCDERGPESPSTSPSCGTRSGRRTPRSPLSEQDQEVHLPDGPRLGAGPRLSRARALDDPRGHRGEFRRCRQLRARRPRAWPNRARPRLRRRPGMGYTEIKRDLVDTYAPSSFEDTRRKPASTAPLDRRSGRRSRGAEAAGERPRHPRALAQQSFSR
jgi:hypothetical protein